MQDDMAELLEDMSEIQDIMGRSYGYYKSNNFVSS